MSDDIAIELDQRSLDRARKTLEKYQGKPLAERLERGSLQGARLLVTPIRDAAPIGPTRNLRNKVRARKARTGIGAIVGSTAPHRHLVIDSHRIVTPGGHDTGRRTTGNPFVDTAARPRIDTVVREVQRILDAP